jgi:hypothetical protein
VKLCIDVAAPPLPRSWVRLIWIIIIVGVARASGAPSEALPLILGGLATVALPGRRALKALR